MQKTWNTRGEIEMTSLAIGLLVLGIIAGIGASISIAVRNSRTTSLQTVQVVNESLASLTDAPVTLGNGWVSSIDKVVNASNGATVNTGNYTLTTENTNFGVATIKNAANNPAGYNASDALKVTYTRYNISQPDWDTANDAAVGIGQFGSWFRIIVIVGIAAVILGIIFAAFGGKKSGGASY